MPWAGSGLGIESTLWQRLRAVWNMIFSINQEGNDGTSIVDAVKKVGYTTSLMMEHSHNNCIRFACK